MKTQFTDPIIAQIRAVRDEHAARFGYDVEAIFRDIRARQEASGREYVRYPARRAAPPDEKRAAKTAIFRFTTSSRKDEGMRENGRCPIWNTPVREYRRDSHDGVYVDSPRAGGRYFIAGTAQSILDDKSPREKARLTSWLVERRKLGEDYPEIKSSIVEEVKRRRVLEAHERADRLLLCISSVISNNIAGTFVRPPLGNETDPKIQRMLASAECVAMRELEYLVGYLVRRRWVEDAVGFMNASTEYQVSVEGHARLAELNQTTAASSKAFVAMWFDESMDEVWENAIEPGIEDAGYEAVRIDRKEHLNKIDDEIIAELRRARFVVADFTQGEDGARGGVYYEAGFAHGRSIPIIFSCRADAIEKVHASIQPHRMGSGETGRVPRPSDETHLCRHRRWATYRMNERFSAWLAR